jgi:hypothetical protein
MELPTYGLNNKQALNTTLWDTPLKASWNLPSIKGLEMPTISSAVSPTQIGPGSVAAANRLTQNDMWAVEGGVGVAPAGYTSIIGDTAKGAFPLPTNRDDVSYLGGTYTNKDGVKMNKEMFGPDYEVGGESKTDWGMEGLGGTLLGAGQLGLGIASYLENSKTAGKQRALMDQQITNNKFALSTAKERQSDIAATFGKK